MDVDPVAELEMTVRMFKRWQNHPAFDALRKSLRGDTEDAHTVMVLALASYLSDGGNAVGLADPKEAGRVPDLFLVTDGAEDVVRSEIEVKTPLFLRGPRSEPLKQAIVEGRIDRLLKKAASSNGGQLDTKLTGLVAFGGFHLGRQEFAVVQRAVSAVLKKQARQQRKPHVAGVSVTNIWASMTMAPDGPRYLGAAMETSLIRHTAYKGSATIDDRPGTVEPVPYRSTFTPLVLTPIAGPDSGM